MEWGEVRLVRNVGKGSIVESPVRPAVESDSILKVKWNGNAVWVRGGTRFQMGVPECRTSRQLGERVRKTKAKRPGQDREVFSLLHPWQKQ